MFLKSLDLKFENKDKIKITKDDKIIISSNFLSLEEISYFYLKMLPSLLLNNNFSFKIYPYFPKLKEYSSKAQACIILLHEDNFRNNIIKMYENGDFK